MKESVRTLEFISCDSNNNDLIDKRCEIYGLFSSNESNTEKEIRSAIHLFIIIFLITHKRFGNRIKTRFMKEVQ